MGIFGKIILGFLVLIVIAVIADIMTWFYEYWWIFVAIIGIVLLIRFILNDDFRQKVFRLIVGRNYQPSKRVARPVSFSKTQTQVSKDSFKEFLEMVAVDGEISEAEKRSLIKKGVDMGLSANEAAIIIEAKIVELKAK